MFWPRSLESIEAALNWLSACFVRVASTPCFCSISTTAATLKPESVNQLPIVLIDREISGSSLPVVGIDNVGGAEAMIEHLFEQGHRRIAILTGPEGNYDSEQRLIGCCRALSRLGISFDEKQLWRGNFTVASGVRAARELLDSRAPMPDAIFCLNDAMAIGMLSELQRSGVSVPRDVALAGYDNDEAASQLALTSVVLLPRCG